MFRLLKKKEINPNADNDCFLEICDALREVMPIDRQGVLIKKTTEIESLGIDSIKYINLFVNLENIIGRDLDEIIDEIDLSSIVIVEDLVLLVKNLKAK